MQFFGTLHAFFFFELLCRHSVHRLMFKLSHRFEIVQLLAPVGKFVMRIWPFLTTQEHSSYVLWDNNWRAAVPPATYTSKRGWGCSFLRVVRVLSQLAVNTIISDLFTCVCVKESEKWETTCMQFFFFYAEKNKTSSFFNGLVDELFCLKKVIDASVSHKATSLICLVRLSDKPKYTRGKKRKQSLTTVKLELMNAGWSAAFFLPRLKYHSSYCIDGPKGFKL